MSSHAFVIEQYVPVVGWVRVETCASEDVALSHATRRQAELHLAKSPGAELRVRHAAEVPVTLGPRERPQA